MKKLIFGLFLTLGATIVIAEEWLHANILFNNTGDPFTVAMKVAGECDTALKCYHKIDVVSVERPLDVKSIIIDRHAQGSTAKLIQNPCEPNDPTNKMVEFPLNVPRTGIWYIRAETCWASNDLCSGKVDSRIATSALVKCNAGGWMMYKYIGKPTIGF